MLHTIVCLFLSLLLIGLPVSAASVDENSDIELLSVSGDLTSGYYFVADCDLGSNIRFYIPLEWAYYRFTTDDSGDLVNLSTSTCYAYSPDFPDYTFSCSRLSTFTYRYSNYSSSDLNITRIVDTNMSLLINDPFPLSDSEIQLLIAALILICAGILIIRRG